MVQFDVKKGTTFDLQKEAPGITKFRVELAWEKNPHATGGKYDADLSAAALKLVNGQPKIVDHPYLCFYNAEKMGYKPIDALRYGGDNREGGSEHILVDTSLLDPDIVEVAFVGTIDNATVRKQHWGLTKAVARLYSGWEGNDLLAEYRAAEEANGLTSFQFVSLYQSRPARWDYKVIGEGFANADLSAFLERWT